MSTLVTKKEFKERMIYVVGTALIILALIACFDPAFADDALTTALNVVKQIAAIICFVLGAIYLLNGIIKYAQAHADDNGMQEKKASNTIATAVILIIVGGVLTAIDLSWVISAVDAAKGSM